MLLAVFARPVDATPPAGPPLDARYLELPTEPPGPSSRRSGVVISEIMYHPARRPDGRDLQFIEVFNSMPWFEDLSGWQITGSAGFTFPQGFVLPSQGYAVVAVNPSDLTTITGATNVLGPFTGSLPNSSGTLKLRHRGGAIMFEVQYSDSAPWPAAADGFGPSLVLVRPSRGEQDPNAWAASGINGGSPSGPEPPNPGIPSGVRINELFAALLNSATGPKSFIEIYNYSATAADLGGWSVSDRSTADRYTFPNGTQLGPGGHLELGSDLLGFEPNPTGSVVCLRTATRQVIDCLRYGPLEPGVALGRSPDGVGEWLRLGVPTPGSPNATPLASPVVINEVMYHPASEDPDDEFVELYNSSPAPVPLDGWRISGGIDVTFPAGARLAAGGYGVVARNPSRLMASHPALKSSAILASFTGTLSHSGDSLALSRPVPVVSPDGAGGTTTHSVDVVMESLSYGTGGRWGRWSDGGGSSLERIHPQTDGRFAPAWADSDESAKSDWVTVESTGVLDNGASDGPTSLEIVLFGPGECLIDHIEVISTGGTNLVANPDFETGTNTWVFQGNHDGSSLETTEGFQSRQSLHVRATAAGNTGPNRIRTALAVQPVRNRIATLRAHVRWLKGSGNILLRLHGNWLDAPGKILTTRALGTPGAPNSRRLADPVPLITGVQHDPVLPTVNQPVRIVAHATAAHPLDRLILRWRVDPNGATNEIAMTDNGAGLYSAMIPGQVTGSLVAFHIVAVDASPSGNSAIFPADAPVRECLIRWGENNVAGALGGYRIWMTQATFTRWSKREKLSNEPLDVTFAYGNSRVIYNAGGQYSGSPYHAPGYNTPTGFNCDYLLIVPPDDALLGEEELELLQPGNGGGDTTCQEEQHAYWIADQMGLPACHHRPVLLYVNGARRGIVYDDAQQPGRKFVSQWFPDDPDGELRKIQLWFEFDPSGASFSAVSATLGRFTTTGGVKKPARYRWTWPVRAFGDDPNDFTNLFNLVDAVNTGATGDGYTRTLLHATDVLNWFRTDVVEHLVGNNDSYSYGGGQNMYAYKPQHGPWNLLIWDIDFAFASADPRSTMDNIGGRDIGPINTHPPFARLYWQVMQEALNGPLLPERSSPMVDARFAGLRANGATTTASGAGIKSFMTNRRSYLLGLITNKVAALVITFNGGKDFTSSGNSMTLTGTAPLDARTITLNDTPIDVIWTSITNWTYRVSLSPGTNRFVLGGLDVSGAPLARPASRLNVVYTGSSEEPAGRVVINEILPLPALPQSGFIEIANRSTIAFDLSGWRIDGAGFTFPAGTLLPANGYAVVVEDPFAFADAFSPLVVPTGVYSGRLNPNGETLRLIRPGVPPTADEVVDELTYETTAPWPDALQSGASLQLISTGADHNRVAAWGSAGPTAPRATPGADNFQSPTAATWPSVRLNELLVVNQTGAPDLTGQRGPWVELFNSGTTPAVLTNCFLSDTPSQPQRWRFPTGTRIPAGGYLQVWLDARGNQSTERELHASFKPSPDGGLVLLSQLVGAQLQTVDFIRYSGSTPDFSIGCLPDGEPADRRLLSHPTPLASNTSTGPGLQVFINEWMARNDTTLRDSADGAYSDWFELFNAGTSTASLAGCFLSTSTNDTRQFSVPAGYSIPAGGRLLVWADKKPTLNTGGGDLHAGFKLAAGGGTLALYSPEGTRIDGINYGPQTADISEGRIPDGGTLIAALPSPTPRGQNATPVPSVFAIQVTAGLANVSWSTLPGLTYQLETTSSLGQAGWDPLGAPTTATGRTLTATSSLPDASQQFFRVRVRP